MWCLRLNPVIPVWRVLLAWLVSWPMILAYFEAGIWFFTREWFYGLYYHNWTDSRAGELSFSRGCINFRFAASCFETKFVSVYPSSRPPEGGVCWVNKPMVHLDWTSVDLTLPLWTLLVVPISALAWRYLSHRRRICRGLCPFCSYDLRASASGLCPECGYGRVART